MKRTELQQVAVTINRPAPGAIATNNVTALHHELWDDAVKDTPLVRETGFTSANLPKVFFASTTPNKASSTSSLWNNIRTQLNSNAASVHAVNLDFKVYSGQRFWCWYDGGVGVGVGVGV